MLAFQPFYDAFGRACAFNAADPRTAGIFDAIRQSVLADPSELAGLLRDPARRAAALRVLASTAESGKAMTEDEAFAFWLSTPECGDAIEAFLASTLAMDPEEIALALALGRVSAAVFRAA
jgi:hypothetical protein